MALAAALGFEWYRGRQAAKQAEQSEACWSFYGSTELLNRRAEECLVMKYGWSTSDALLEVIDRQAEAKKSLDRLDATVAAARHRSDSLAAIRDEIRRIMDSLARERETAQGSRRDQLGRQRDSLAVALQAAREH